MKRIRIARRSTGLWQAIHWCRPDPTGPWVVSRTTWTAAVEAALQHLRFHQAAAVSRKAAGR